MPARKKAQEGSTGPRTTFVALLRGINVGGKNMLPMANLSAMFVKAGCSRVQTYIQSGNVVFDADAGAAETLPGQIQRAIAARFGYSIPVVTRTAGDLAAVAGDNPFLSQGVDPDRLHVVFIAGAPDATRAAALDPNRSPPDQLIVRGREIYLFCPNGMGRTRITNAYLDTTLATTTTVRNWRTVQTLAAMTRGEPANA